MILAGVVLDQVIWIVLWGTTAYVAFRALGAQRSRWYVGVLIAYLAFLAYDYILYLVSEAIKQYAADQDEFMTELLKHDRTAWSIETGIAGILVGKVLPLVKILIGFQIADWILHDNLQGDAKPSTGNKA